jgi:hypothetical protein
MKTELAGSSEAFINTCNYPEDQYNRFRLNVVNQLPDYSVS